MNLKQLQDEVGEWSYDNFGDQSSYRCLLGVVEEVGELCHAHLKLEQKIRVASMEDQEDAVADILIFLADYCSRSDIDLDAVVTRTWAEVRLRDWKKYPETGRPLVIGVPSP